MSCGFIDFTLVAAFWGVRGTHSVLASRAVVLTYVSLEEGSTPPPFVVAHVLMGRGWSLDPGPTTTLEDFEGAARLHVASIKEIVDFTIRVSTFYAEEAMAMFERTQIAAQFVAGPIDGQYRVVTRNELSEVA